MLGKFGARAIAAATLIMVMGVAACDAKPSGGSNVVRLAEAKSAKAPKMRWGNRAGSDDWTRAALRTLESEGVTLLSSVPSDVKTYCPGYASLNREDRKHFWVGLLSSVAKHESGYNPTAKGGGGRYLGLMQISQSTARHYNCKGNMLNGSDNMACAVKIAARNVGRDGAIAAGQRGVARDWMPLRSTSKRSDIAAWTSQQAYCGR
ncbi:transglycosylase SLT domain-containing protein [Paracoccus aminophilus]|uniref:Lytic transglycosylase n=1 Tax=Paracoccus aminophilus JCM 7686 TaxID=1367847 RepID=S5XL67_PARAH|nr:transglycosylase SLT domain-containing protein [Paracoccus aminophilus]AGT07954.1 lytic transglycosylase [Paracoccus aminophilus JCM 7686]